MINFSIGPSQLFFTIQDHVRKAFKDGFLSESIRSNRCREIYANAVNHLREFLNLPSDFEIVFAPSLDFVQSVIASELITDQSVQIINGKSSDLFAATTTNYHQKQIASSFDNLVHDESIVSPDFITLTFTARELGYSLSSSSLAELKQKHAATKLIVDASSSLPHENIEFKLVDLIYFSTDEGFGLPSGLVVLAIQDKLAESITTKSSNGFLSRMIRQSKELQSPILSNMLNLYLLSMVVSDMNRRTLQTIQRETNYKAAILYQEIESNPILQPLVERKVNRSRTHIAFSVTRPHQELINMLKEKNLMIHHEIEMGSDHYCVGNFPAHSKEQMELLVDTLHSFV